jgi:hypothetical protein
MSAEKCKKRTKNDSKKLTLEQKKDIACELLDKKQTGTSYRKLATKYNTSKSTIQRIEEQSELYLKLESHTDQNSIPGSNLPYKLKTIKLNEHVFKQYRHLRSNNIPVSGPLIREIAIKFASKNHILNFKASDGWFRGFKLRNKLRYKKLSGEKKSSDYQAAEDYVMGFNKIINGYLPENVFNCDETGIYIRCMPDNSFVEYGEEECSGTKIDKERITCLYGCSMRGEKLPIMVIGRSKNPRCFANIDVNTLGIMYDSNKSAWMTKRLFEKYVEKVNEKMILENRKILLLLDCCASHKISKFSNVELSFLPPNTTALIQPLDQGIIKACKDRYKTLLLKHVCNILTIETHDKINLPGSEVIQSHVDVFKPRSITILDAILWLHDSWINLPEEIITNCWRKGGLICTEDDEKDDDEFDDEKDDVLVFEEEIVTESILNPDEIQKVKELKFMEIEIEEGITIEKILHIKSLLYKLKNSMHDFSYTH